MIQETTSNNSIVEESGDEATAAAEKERRMNRRGTLEELAALKARFPSPPSPPPEPPVERQQFPRSETPSVKAPPFVPQGQIEAEIAMLYGIAKRVPKEPELIDVLRVELAQRPHLLHHLADMQRAIENKIIEHHAPGDLVKREAFRQRASQLRAALIATDCSPFAQLAASRVVTCWMLVQLLDSVALSEPFPHHQKLLLQAEKRLETAYRIYDVARRISALRS